MATSQNGYTAPPPRLRAWRIPTPRGVVVLPLRDGAVGFVLAVWALWYAERIEPLVGRIRDDWGYAWRLVRGQTAGLSNHASGTAMDLNATTHPLGKRGTLKAWQYVKIKAHLVLYRLVIRSGIYYHARADEMHYEINASVPRVVACATRLTKSKRGRRVLAANHMTAAQATKSWAA